MLGIQSSRRNCKNKRHEEKHIPRERSVPPVQRRSASLETHQKFGKQRSTSLTPAPVSDARDDLVTDEYALDVLLADLEQRVPFAPRTSTPPAWRRPWLASPRNVLLCECDKVDNIMAPQVPIEEFVHAPAAPPNKRRPLLGSAHRRGDVSPRMLEKVLHELLPLADDRLTLQSLPSTVLHGESSRMPSGQVVQSETSRRLASSPVDSRPRSPGSFAANTSNTCGDASAEVAAFRTALSKSYGNLTRAFRAMKNAVSLHGKGISPSGIGQGSATLESCRLTCAELEWCVSAYLHYGDRRLARRIFAAISKEGKDDIGLLELAPEGSNLFSLVEFRRLLLERHRSLECAFRELEEYLARSNTRLRGRGGRMVPLAEFVKATAFFGLTPQQAGHFFSVMDADGDGSLSLNEFLEALTHMPRAVLLSDMRQRLLVRYPSIPHAFRELSHAAGNMQLSSARLDREGFASSLAKLGIVDIEAAELFSLCDDDNSGDVSLDELREAMRDVSPTIRLAEFWQRFAAEWPEIVVAARQEGSSGRVAAGALILEMLPEDLQQACAVSACFTLSTRGTGSQPQKAIAKRALCTLSLEAFDALAALLDISRENANEIFRQIQRAASLQRKPASSRVRQKDAEEGTFGSPIIRREEKYIVYAEDFLEQLQLWTENPCRRASGDPLDPHRDVVQQMVAPTKAAISALKAELLASSRSQPSRDVVRDVAAARSRVTTKRLPKLPWQAFGGCRESFLA